MAVSPQPFGLSLALNVSVGASLLRPHLNELPTRRSHSQPGLPNLHVPEKRCTELEHVPNILSKGCWLDSFSPRQVRHFAESNFLDLVGELFLVSLSGHAQPVGDELVELRDVRPTKPGARACARDAEVDGRIEDVSALPPRVKQVPATFVGRLLACPHDQARRPIHRLEDDLEAD